MAAHYTQEAPRDEARFLLHIRRALLQWGMPTISPKGLLLSLFVATLAATAILAPTAADAQSGEPTPVAELREYPDRYHLHQVLLQGTAHDVRAFDPYKVPAGTVCYGAYSFLLEDETGSIPVIVMGRCGLPIVKDPDVDDGDQVAVQATVHEPGKGTFFLTLDGRRIPFSDSDSVQGVATNIWTIAKAAASPEGADSPDSVETPDMTPRR
ncbi:MAG: hypothetical protein U0172_11620 [Nitrospiraceae bacterium]